MAEAFARRDGAGVVNCASAGLAPAVSVDRETREVMREAGIELTDHFPKEYEPALAEKYDVVVNISGYELPPLRHPVLVEWDVADPLGEAGSFHRAVRDEIEKRVRNLVTEIQEGKPVSSDAPDGQRIAPQQVRKPRLWQRFTRSR